jgi:hypothetical protein
MVNVVYCTSNDLCKNNLYYALSTPSSCNPNHLPSSHTGIANSGASGTYFLPATPMANLNPKAPSVGVLVANGLLERSVASATLASVPSLPPAAMQGHVMPSFPHTLINLGPFADLGCQTVFTKTAVSVIHPDGHSILEGWREQDDPCLWRFPLKANKPSLPVTALSEKYEQLGPRGSAANFFRPPPSSPTQCPAALPSMAPACPLTADPATKKYEEPGPRRSTDNFFPPPPSSPIQCLAALPSSHPLTADPMTLIYPSQGCLAIDDTARPAWSLTCTEWPRPWRWQPSPPRLPLIPEASTFPAWVLSSESTMHALAFLSSKHGSTPSRQATVTPSMGSPTPTLQDTARIQTRRSWVILPSNARMFGLQSPGLLSLNKSRCFQQLPPKHQASLPTKSTSVSSPSASSTWMTLDDSPSRPVPATIMS